MIVDESNKTTMNVQHHDDDNEHDVVVLKKREIWNDWNSLRTNTLKPYYQTYIKDICWSFCGTFLVSCDNQHQLTIWNTTATTNETKLQYKNTPLFHQLQFYTTNDILYLICASTTGIYFYRWNTLVSSFNRTTPVKLEHDEFVLTSSLLTEKSQFCVLGENQLCVTNTNGQVLVWDITTQQLQSTIQQSHFSSLSTITSPHPHQIILSGCSNNSNNQNDHHDHTTMIASIWDVSQSKLIDTITASSSTTNSAAITTNSMVWDKGDWMVCGGDGFLATMHLPTRTMNSYMMTRESISDVSIGNNTIYSVGNEGVISAWDNCTHLSRRTHRAWLSTPSATTLASSSKSNILVVGGKGATLDCFTIPSYTTTSFGTKSHILTL